MSIYPINLFRLVALLTISTLIVGSVKPVYAQDPPPQPTLITFPRLSQSSCCSYDSPGNPYPCCSGGNCTWWAWREYKNATGISLNNYGNAKDWKRYAEPDGSPPRVGAIAVFQPCVYGAHCKSIPGCPGGCGHVAYVTWVDNPQNPTRFKTSNMGCFGNCQVKDSAIMSVIPGVNFIYPPNVDTTKPTNPTTVSSPSHSVNQWSANKEVTVIWSGASDPAPYPSGVGGYSWAWSQDAATIPYQYQLADENTTQTTGLLRDTGQSWYFHIRTRDKSNNWADDAAHLGPFWIDADDPINPTSVQETHGAPDAWQNTVNDPAFVWSGASDKGSGIAHYLYYWGDDASGVPNIQTTSTSFDPPAPCALGDVCKRYLRIQTIDVSGRSSQPVTLYTFRYDGQPPTGTFQINNGSGVAFQVAVQIQLTASDIGSELYQMRVSNDGMNWPGGWQELATSFEWILDAVPNITQTVHLEISDYAGNITSLPTQTIQLDLSGGRPRSENYQIFTDVQGRGGGTKASSGYSLNGTTGQVIAGNGTAGQLYRLESGFQGAWPAQPSDPPPVESYQLLDSVIGQGGGHKLSQGYQMSGTLGQSIQTGELTSANYKLTSGFWARVMNIGQPPPSPTPTPEVTATLTPTPTSTPTVTITPPPPPEFYGVSINQAATFTHDYRVTLYLDAPDAVEMMVSNDGGFTDAYWEAYATTKLWEIDFYQNYVLPRTVYVRYRDANGVIHGNFTDDIIYDPNLPTGDVSIANVSAGNVLLNLNLQDDLSGVSQVMIATSDNLANAQWETYSTFKTVAAQPGDVIYVYYRDAAGNESLYPFEIQVPGGANKIYLPLVKK